MTLREDIKRWWRGEFDDEEDVGDNSSGTELSFCCGVREMEAQYIIPQDVVSEFRFNRRIVLTTILSQGRQEKLLRALGFRRCGPRSFNRIGQKSIQLWDLTRPEFMKKWGLRDKKR